jgi:hypothetical protein
MRILWVDDDTKRDNYWFGDFADQHDIFRTFDFSESYEEITFRLNNFDLVILDIDLFDNSGNIDVDKFSEQLGFYKDEKNSLDLEAFLREAGFHLYILLLYQGFPLDRVIFLTANNAVDTDKKQENIELVKQYQHAYDTGNLELYKKVEKEIKSPERMLHTTKEYFAELINTCEFPEVIAWLNHWANPTPLPGEREPRNTYGALKKRFDDARLKLSAPIEKHPQTTSRILQKWLAEHCTPTKDPQLFYYLTLRRAMLDIIAYIEKKKEIDLQGKFAEELDKTSFLAGLKWQLREFKLPENADKTVYFAACDYLSKPFEIFNGIDLVQQQDSLKLPLYYLRNWIAHGLIIGSENTKLDAQVTGFAFLLAMKAMFGIELYGHKKVPDELKRLYPEKAPTLQEIKERKADLSRSHYRNRKDEDVFQPIHNKGQKERNTVWQSENYLIHFYAAYLFADNDELKTPFFSQIAWHGVKNVNS